MAGFVAKKLCPQLKFISPDFKLYVECSKKIFAILEQYGPISPASLDEACKSCLRVAGWCWPRVDPGWPGDRLQRD